MIEYEGIEEVDQLAIYDNKEIESMAYCISKRTPANTRIKLGMARTKALEEIAHWVRKKSRKRVACDLHEVTPEFITELILALNADSVKDKADLTLYYPDTFIPSDYKNWVKKMTKNYLDSRMGKARVPLSYVICAADADPNDAPDEYTRALWAASFETRQYRDDNREV